MMTKAVHIPCYTNSRLEDKKNYDKYSRLQDIFGFMHSFYHPKVFFLNVNILNKSNNKLEIDNIGHEYIIH